MFDSLYKSKHINKYLDNYGILKQYTEENYRLVAIRKYRQAGFEDEKIFTHKGEAGNDGKLRESISRAKNRVFELAMCNDWEYFVTFTLDKEKYDRYNIKKFRKDISQFIRDNRKKYKEDIKYLLIPEMHKDGAWHMHGLLMGLSADKLEPFTLDMILPQKIRNRIAMGKKVYKWPAYAKKFGFSDIEIIENKEASAKYITKYITEEIDKTITELESNIYYCSQGLNRAEVIKRDTLFWAIEEPQFQNEYVAIKHYENKEDAIKLFEIE